MTHPDQPGAGRSSWGTPRLALDPLAALLRGRFHSRAALARASGLGYQTLRTFTDGRWTGEQPPSQYVLTALARAVDPDELDRAVRESIALRAAPPLTLGQRVILEALRDYDDERLIAAAPFVTELLRDFPASQDDRAGCKPVACGGDDHVAVGGRDDRGIPAG